MREWEGDGRWWVYESKQYEAEEVMLVYSCIIIVRIIIISARRILERGWRLRLVPASSCWKWKHSFYTSDAVVLKVLAGYTILVESVAIERVEYISGRHAPRSLFLVHITLSIVTTMRRRRRRRRRMSILTGLLLHTASIHILLTFHLLPILSL